MFCVVKRLFVPCLFALLGIGSAYSQGFGTIVGTITDPSGGLVAGASVKVTDPATGQFRDVTANAQGYYVVPALKPSKYDITVNAPGFAPYTQAGIVLQADQSLTVNAAVSLVQTSQALTVSAEVAQVNTTTATLSEVVDQRKVVDLPLNGRNAASLLLVVAGATPAPANDVDQGNTKTFPSTVTVSTNGSRQNQVSFRLDGANNNDLYTNANQPFPFPDALQEFSVQTSNYSARYGGNAGGVVNVVTKSGTNDLHGSGFEFVRNAVFNARNYFAVSRDQLKRNQYGGTLGGPVVIPHFYNGKNRTFFFFGYQGTRIRNVTSSSNAYVPTAAEMNGDFSALQSASNPGNPFGKAVNIVDPRTGTAFPGNRIDPSRFDPAAVAFTKLLPSGVGNGLVFYSQPVSQDFNEYLGRVDHSISDNDRLSFRYFFDKFNNAAFLNPTNYLSNSNYSVIDSQNALIAHTHVFGPGALNELRVNFGRETSNRGPAPGSVSLGDLGVNLYQPPTAKTIEGINVSGYFSPGQTDPASFIRNQYAISDDFNWVLGRHSLSFGGSVTRAQMLLRNQFRTSGSYTFTADTTNDALASFMLGYIRTFTQGFGEFKDNLLTTYGLYVQDDFHVSRRLTLNLGVRYDPQYPWQERKKRIEQFSVSDYNANVRSQQFINAPPGLLFPGDPGVPEWGVKANLKNVDPRVGFAWDVTGDGRTSIRAGAGVFYDSIQNGIFNNRFVDVTPFSPQFSLTTPPGPFSNPYVGFANPYPAPFPPPKDSAFPGPVLVITYDPAHGGVQQTPVVYNWNFSVERQLGQSWVVRGSYVGSQSRHLLESLELNPAVYTAGSKLSTDARRAFQPFGSITQAAQDINSGYNSLQFTAQKHLSRGFSILANYTWAKSIDDMPYGQGITTAAAGSNSPVPWNFGGRHQYDRGPSEFDHTHRFVASYVWDLPSLSHRNLWVRTFAGGWQLTGIFTAQSGGPLTVMAGKDQSATGIGVDRGQFVSSNAYGSGACGSTGPCVNYLDPAAFALPALGTYGNVGKGSLRGPHLVNWDTGLFKEFPLSAERLRLQFRAEFFNVLNHTNFSDPKVGFSSGGFGSITGSNDPRIGQLALKLLF